MSSIACRNGGIMHSHDSVEAVRQCADASTATPSTGAGTPAPYTGWRSQASTRPAQLAGVAPSNASLPPTDRQVSYIENLGGDMRATSLFTREQASRYIGILTGCESHVAAAIAQTRTETPPAYVRPALAKLDPAIIRLMGTLDDGYYAWQPDTDTALVFIKIKERKVARTASRRRGQRFTNLKGSRVISSQHGPDYTEEAFIFPSGDSGYLRDGCGYEGQPHNIRGSVVTLEDALLGIIADRYRCARAYALEKGRCCRCHLDLTDKRSRWYGIGPDCEQVWPSYLEEVDNEKGMTYEEAERLGLVS